MHLNAQPGFQRAPGMSSAKAFVGVRLSRLSQSHALLQHSSNPIDLTIANIKVY